MKHRVKFALAVGLPLAVFGVSSSASAVATPTTTPPGGAIPATAPAGWPLLVDSTGAIQVNVPTEWTDVDLLPGAMDGGAPIPRITASTSIADFEQSFATSGMIFGQYPITATPAEVLTQYVPGPCGAETTEPYDDGVFQGQLRHQTQCGQTGEYYTLAATTASRPGAVFLVEVGIASAAEVTTVEGIFSTFNIASGGTTPPLSTPAGTVPAVPTIPAVPTVPTVTLPSVTVPSVTVPSVTLPSVTVPSITVPSVTLPSVTVPSVTVPSLTVPSITLPSVTVASTPAGPAANPVLPTPGNTLPVAADSVKIADDTAHISMNVPADWTAHVTSPQTSATGAQLPFLAASTDLVAFPTTAGAVNTFAAPGVTYTAQAFSAAPTVDYPVALPACTDAGVEAYDDGLFTGELHHYTNCGGTQTRVFTLHASPVDNSFTAVLVIQLTDADNTDLDTILGSFNVFEGSFAAG